MYVCVFSPSFLSHNKATHINVHFPLLGKSVGVNCALVPDKELAQKNPFPVNRCLGADGAVWSTSWPQKPISTQLLPTGPPLSAILSITNTCIQKDLVQHMQLSQSLSLSLSLFCYRTGSIFFSYQWMLLQLTIYSHRKICAVLVPIHKSVIIHKWAIFKPLPAI